MAVATPSLFAQVIQDHLELKRRNAALEHEMPLEKYMTDDPFENHPLFKTEEQARVEDTMDGAQSIVDEPTSLDWPSDVTFPGPRRSRHAECRRARKSSRTKACGRARATSTGVIDTGGEPPVSPRGLPSDTLHFVVGEHGQSPHSRRLMVH